MTHAKGKTENNPLFSKRRLRSGLIPYALLVFFSVLIAADHLLVPKVPMNVDPASYAVVSHELLLGQSLYTDIWDHKHPAIFIVYGIFEIVFGYTPETLVIINVFVSLTILLGIYYAGKAGRGGVTVGLWASALWVILSGTFQLESRDPNTEPFLNACIIWAFGLLAAERKDGLKLRTSVTIGLLFLLGSMFKPVIVAVAFFLVTAYILTSSDKKRAIIDGALIASVGVVGWIATFGYFAATNRYQIFYESVITYNRFYAGNMWMNILAPLNHQAELFPDFINLLALFGFAGIIFTFFHNRRQAILLTAFIAATWIAIALPGRFSVHYFQLWLPPLIIGASWTIGTIAELKNARFRLMSYAAGALLIGIIFINQIAVYEVVFTNKWVPFIPLLNAGDETAKKINDILEKDETFFLWGNTPTLYVLSGRRPATPILFHLHFEENPLSQQHLNRVKADLDRNRPELLVVENSRPPVPDWMAQEYEPTPVYYLQDAYSIYVRRGGRISTQSLSASTEQ